jgi:hypothetical protein
MRALVLCLLMIWMTVSVDAGMRDEETDRRPGCAQLLP